MNLLKAVSAAAGGSPTPGPAQKFSPVSANRSNPAIANTISSCSSANANSTSNKMLYVKTPTRRMPSSSLHFSRISSAAITADQSPS